MYELCRNRGQLRNSLLIIFCVHTALRISDILKLRWDDAYDFETHTPLKYITLTEKKTGKMQTVFLNNTVRAALSIYAPSSAETGAFLFKSRHRTSAISRIQAYRIIRQTAEDVGIENRVSCHSLRKTFGYLAWKNGVSPAILVEIYNHSSLAVTRRYLGVTQDDKDDVYQRMSLLI